MAKVCGQINSIGLTIPPAVGRQIRAAIFFPVPTVKVDAYSAIYSALSAPIMLADGSGVLTLNLSHALLSPCRKGDGRSEETRPITVAA